MPEAKYYIPVNRNPITKQEALKLKKRAKDQYPYVQIRKEKGGYRVYVHPGYEKENKR